MRLEERPVEGTEPRGPKRLPDNPEDFKATLAEHIDELRQRIVRSLVFLVAAWTAGWFVQPWVYAQLNDLISSHIIAVVGPDLYREAFRNATEMFMLKLKLSFLLGLIVSIPFIVVQIWGFIKPGLKPSERKPLERAGPLSVFLFVLGASFCWLVLPATIRFFATFLKEFEGAQLIQEPGFMVFFVLKMMLAFGLGFQLPLFVYALGAMNLLSAKFLLKHWRQSAAGIFIFSAVLTPSGDAATMLMLAVPLVVLFIMSAYAVKYTQRRKQALSDVVEPPIE